MTNKKYVLIPYENSEIQYGPYDYPRALTMKDLLDSKNGNRFRIVSYVEGSNKVRNKEPEIRNNLE